MTANYTERENKLKAKVQAVLKADFYLKPEVSGCDLVHGEPVRVDFLAWPLAHVTAAGFPRQVVAIEVKFLEGDDIGGLAELCWQGITYQQSEYPVEGKVYRPLFTLLYANGVVDKDPHGEYANAWRWAARLLQRANVGLLDLEGRHRWQFMFGPNYYARGGTIIEMSNAENVGVKIYVGNCAEGRGLTTRYGAPQ